MKTKRVLGIIQARMDSKRLPGKVLLDLGGRPVIEHVYRRATAVAGLQHVVIATTTNKEDDLLVEWASKNAVPFFRGSSDDVADRFLCAAGESGYELIARFTADCPLLDPKICSQVVAKALAEDLDFCSNYIPATFPDGLDFSLFKRQRLLEEYNKGLSDYDREHVTTVFERMDRSSDRKHIVHPLDYSARRWTLDNYDDYVFLNRLALAAGPELIEMEFSDILELLAANPDIALLESGFERNYGHRT